MWRKEEVGEEVVFYGGWEYDWEGKFAVLDMKCVNGSGLFES